MSKIANHTVLEPSNKEEIIEAIEKLKELKETYIEKYKELNIPITENILTSFDENIKAFNEELKSYEKSEIAPEEDYSSLYATNDSDIMMLADDLSAIDSKLQKETAGTALMIKESLQKAKDDIEEMQNIIDLEPDTYREINKDELEIDVNNLEKMGQELIAEHPIKFIFSQTAKSINEGINNITEAISDSIMIASNARKAVYDKDYEYKTSKSEAVEAVRKMGRENYPIINPTRLLTLETIKNKVNDISKSIIDMNKTMARSFARLNIINKKDIRQHEWVSLGAYSEAIKNSEKYKDNFIEKSKLYEKYSPSFMKEQVKMFKDLAENTNSSIKKEYYEECAKVYQENYDYINSPELTQDCWKDGISLELRFQNEIAKTKNEINDFKDKTVRLGKKAVDNSVNLYKDIKKGTEDAIDFVKNLDIDEIKIDFLEKSEKYLNTCINEYNKICDKISSFLVNDVDFYKALDKNLSIKQVKYEKAAEEVGEVQKKITQSLDLLGTLKNKNSIPINDKEIAKNMELMKQIEALREVNASDVVLDNLYANLQKQCANKSKAIVKAENKTRKTEIKNAKKDYKENKKELKSAKSNQKAIEKEKKKLEFLEKKCNTVNTLKNKLTETIDKAKMKEVSFVDRSKELLTHENIKNAIDNHGFIGGNSAIAIQCEKEYCSIDTLNKTISMGVNNQSYETFKIKDFNIVDNKLYVDIDDGKNILQNDLFISSDIVDIDYDASVQFDRDKKDIVDVLNNNKNTKAPNTKTVDISTDLGDCTIDLENKTISSKDFDLKNEPIKSAIEKVNTISFELKDGMFELPRINSIDKILVDNEISQSINNENDIDIAK